MIVTSRRVLRLRGADTWSLLHNLCTGDAQAVGSGAREGMYCNMLSVRGRVLFDAFVQRDASDGSALVEVDASLVPQFTRHLKLYRLRLKVDFDEGCAHSAVHLRGDTRPDFGPSVLVCRDTRLPSSWRAFAPPTAIASLPIEAGAAAEARYERLRFLSGTGEGQLELQFDKSIALENNVDVQEGASFTKGCYLGQELMARAHHVGLVRKRLWPVWLSPLSGGIGGGGEARPSDLASFDAVARAVDVQGPPVLTADAQQSATCELFASGVKRDCGRLVRVSTHYPRLALAYVRISHVEAGPLELRDTSSGAALCLATPLMTPAWAQTVVREQQYQ